MKTLNEVIELSERCTLPYPGDCLNCEYFEDETGYDCRCKIIADALYYLKEYRDKMANDEETYKRGYSCGYAKAKEDEAVSRRWDESYRASQMPWNHGCEMGG